MGCLSGNKMSKDDIIVKVLLAKEFEPDKQSVEGWHLSEKLDGIRAFWSSKHRGLYTRNGKSINAPKWFIEKFPQSIDMDGELWIGRGSLNFNKVSGIARKHVPLDSDWQHVKYLVFDIPDSMTEYEERVNKYTSMIEEIAVDWLRAVEIYKALSNDHVFEELVKIEKMGGEGLMLRKPGSKYEPKRSNTLLKVKSFHDEEGTLIGYSDGTGKYIGMVGALILKLKNGIEVNVGTGLNDEIRKFPPPIGSLIKYKFFEKGANGAPRFPVFIEVRTDVFLCDA